MYSIFFPVSSINSTINSRIFSEESNFFQAGNGKTVEKIVEDRSQPTSDSISSIPSFVTLPETGSIIARDKNKPLRSEEAST